MTTTTKLEITTLSPVTIGSGAEWSPYADYVIDKDKDLFYLLDRNKIIKKIAENDRWLEQYVNGVASGMNNNRSEFDLKIFLTDILRESIDNMSVFRCHVLSDKVSRKLPVKALLRTPLYDAYIPGSTLKGAFKTVLMYKKIKNADIELVLQYCALSDQRERDIEINGWLEKQEQKIEGQELRSKIIQQVTDSTPIPKENSIIVDCWRNMPLRFDCIREKATSQFELTLNKYTWQELAENINSFSHDTLVREFNLLEDDDKNKEYMDELEKILDSCDKSPANVAYMRIGFGKGYFANSIGDALFAYIEDLEDAQTKQKMENIFQKYLQRIFKKGNKIIQNFDMYKFPRTHLHTIKQQKPLGWIKIEKV
ncbi:MAG: type III-A CRISPR-associated RAMP protein Csm5 [Prevotellaceae bacterium]|jgi:CRISPR type III-A-associated RAMP protein Csm5|nr:type III-A CRISPR-associated RAMP protein Csm5 [Prevotellaceae bacterium]